MTNVKLTELTELAAPAVGDKTYIVDVSDTTEGAGGTSKRTTIQIIADFLASLAQTLTNKTLTSPVINTGFSGTAKASAAEVTTGTDDTKIVTPLAAAPYGNSSMARQALINGNFDVWQRGTTDTNPANTTFLADRFRRYLAYDSGTPPTNVVHSRQLQTSGDLAGSYYFYRVAPDGAGTIGNGGQYNLYQSIENGVRNLCGLGKKVTLSFYARSSIANKRIGVGIVQNYGTGGSPTAQETIVGDALTLTSSWAKYTVTFTTNTLVGKTFGTANDDGLGLQIAYAWGTTWGNANIKASVTAETFVGSGTIDIAQVQLCAGDVALPFQPKSFEEELRACQRYYQKSFPYATAPATAVASYAGAIAVKVNVAAAGKYSSTWVNFPVRMRVAPTIVFYNPISANTKFYNRAGADSAEGATSFNELNENGINLENAQVAADAVGNNCYINYAVSSEL